MITYRVVGGCLGGAVRILGLDETTSDVVEIEVRMAERINRLCLLAEEIVNYGVCAAIGVNRFDNSVLGVVLVCCCGTRPIRAHMAPNGGGEAVVVCIVSIGVAAQNY